MAFISGFQIREQLSEGKLSVVFRAIRDSDGMPCVLKVMKSEYPTETDLARYRQEFALTSSLDLPGLIGCHEIRRHNRGLVIVYEDFQAISMAALLRDRALALDEFFDIAEQVVEALGQLHKAGVIHKDISPNNLVLNTATGQVKVIDLGIATRLPTEHQSLTSPQFLEGTLAYMSPEQTGRMNRPLDYRTDFYSLGATFHEMLTRHRPFDAEDAMEMVHCHIARDPTPPHRRNPDVPLALSKIVTKLMAKKAEDRYQSASGLLADLVAVRRGGRLDRFEPGRRDFPEHFQVPQRLYGREADVERLLECFERVRLGRAEMVTVAGYSGVGKSALIHEISKPITRARGYFIGGKFDQFQRNIPYSGLIAAFRDLVRQILTAPEAELAAWRHDLAEALGPSAGVMLDVFPDLELVIGPQPAAPDVDPAEATNRFNRTIAQFLRALCARERTIVLFLDDLQWADAGTLNLFCALLPEPDIGRLLLIGAFRDNEVGPMHPLSLALAKVQETGGKLHPITLEPLRLADLNRLVGDSLQADAAQVAALARLVLQKTQGNPLFVRQFLLALHRQGLIRQLPATGEGRPRWAWELREITAADITDNVVELLLDRMKQLPERTQHALRMAACIGNRFDIDTLSRILEWTPEATFESLQPAVQEELLRHLSEHVVTDEQDALSPVIVRDLGFQHDRVQQAAYDLLDAPAREETHLSIGRRLLATLAPEAVQERVFEVVGQLNRGRNLIATAEERIAVTRLNLVAARRASDAAAYGAALAYIEATLGLLGEDGWGADYALMLEAVQQRALLELLNGHFDACAEAVDAVLRHARTPIERAQAYFPRMALHTLRSQFAEAIAAGRDALGLLGIALPLQDPQASGQAAIAEVMQRLAGREASDLYDAPVLEREDIALAQRCLRHLTIAAFLGDQRLWPLVVGTSVRLSLEHGNAPESALSYANFGLILGAAMGRYREGSEFGELALRLCDRFGGRAPTATVCLVVGAELIPWVEHVREALPVIDRGYQSGLESGDILWAGYLVLYRVLLDAFGGRRLDQLLDALPEQIAFTTRTGNAGATAGIRAHQLVLSMLAGRTASANDFSADGIDEAAFLEDCERNRMAMAVCLHRILKAQALYLMGRPRQALEATQQVEGQLSFIVNHPTLADHLLYQTLAMAVLWRGEASEEGRAALARMQANIAQLRIWAECCPDNFLAKSLMAEAEVARITNDEAAAARLYDRAIEAAHAGEFLQDEALANELAARFEIERRPSSRVGAMFLRDARYAYRLWGANRKVEELELEFPELLTSHHEHPAESFTTTVMRPDSMHASTVGSSGAALDLNTLLKAAQTISGEVMLDQLLDRLLSILIENAGAQRGVLLLARNGALFVEAESSVQADEVEVLMSIRADSPEGMRLCPQSVLNYAMRTREPVVIDDAQADQRFRLDAYVQERGTRSLLCQPILHQGEVIGAVYLENDLIAGAFTPGRSQLLALLSGQIAISIRNAEIVRTLEERVRERTDQLEVRTRFIEETFGRYMSNEIADRLLRSPEELELGGKRQVVTVLMSDLRGFTAQCETLPPETIVSILNNYLGEMTGVIQKYNGTIDGFFGDGILVIFGAPFQRPDDAERAVACALEMQLAMQAVNAWNRAHGFPELEMGIGINTGEVVVGNIGSHKRAKYSVIGSNVNLASRIEGYTVGGQVLVSGATRDAVRARLLIGGEQTVEPKGVLQPVTLYEVRGMEGAHGLMLPESRPQWVELPGIVPVGFRWLTGKGVGPEEQRGHLLRLSAQQAEIRGTARPPLLSNLRFQPEAGGAGLPVADVYAKVVAHGPAADTFIVHFTAVTAAFRDHLDGLLSQAAA